MANTTKTFLPIYLFVYARRYVAQPAGINHFGTKGRRKEAVINVNKIRINIKQSKNKQGGRKINLYTGSILIVGIKTEEKNA